MPRANGPECGTKANSASTPDAALASAVISGVCRCAERAVGIQIAVARRVMRAFHRLAARAGAAGDAADEQRGLGNARRQQRHAGQQDGRGEAARMADVRRGHLLQVLGHGAGELRQAMRRAVRMFVHGLVARGRGEAEVRRDVDEARLGARGFGGLEQRVDQRGGGAMRRGAEHRRGRFLGDQRGDLRLRLERGVAERARQMRERLARELARRAVGHHAREREVRDGR